MNNESARKALCVFLAMIMVGTTFAVFVSTEAEALEFVDSTTITPPWTTSFTPLDSAWDSTGTQCVVVGNETNGKDPSAWLYNEPSNKWHPILEGSDPSVAPVNLVMNEHKSLTYFTIQEAIDEADPGNEIHIQPGTYNENVVIDIPNLQVRGDGAANTVINGGNIGTTLLILADGVTVTGIKATGGSVHTGIMLYEADNCRIENCTVEGNGDGIVLSGSSNNIIKNNDIRNNAGVGVKTESSPVTKELVASTYRGGINDCGALFTMDISGSNYTKTRDFTVGYADGLNPYYTRFIQDTVDPNILYGTTQAGGQYGRGTVFKMNKDGSGHTILHSFLGMPSDGRSPYGGVTQSGSVLYGMTYLGGSADYGCVYRMNTDGSGYSVIHNFIWSTTDGRSPYGNLLVDGTGTVLYGMTSAGGLYSVGTIFSMNTDGTGFSLLRSFQGGATDGSAPRGGLISDGAALYGMTYGGGSASSYGTVFRINPDGSGFNIILSMNSTWTGRYPYGDLYREGSTLYGLTYGGGLNSYGVLFRVNTDSSGFQRLHSFASATGRYPYGSLVGDATYLYGMTYSGGTNTYGTVFSYNKMTSTHTVIKHLALADGIYPYGSLLYDGALYGMTNSGGSFSRGTAFWMTTDGSSFAVRHHFNQVRNDCTYPMGSLAQDGNTIYGASNSGGTGNLGAVYKINKDGTGFTMYSMTGSPNGAYPSSGVTISGGTIYGVTDNGGNVDDGCLYSMNTDGTGFTVLHTFDYDADGAYPRSRPILDPSGTVLYGMANNGGATGCGTIYRINTDGTGFTLLHEFYYSSTDGAYPNGELLLVGSTLYGITNEAGLYDYGTVFKVNTDGSGFQLLHSFDYENDGGYLQGGLVISGNVLYGMANEGGTYGYGTLYRINTDGTGFTVMRNFAYEDGRWGAGSLTLDGDYLYGMLYSGGAYNYGTVFRMQKNTMAFMVLYNFQGFPDAAYPNGNNLLLFVNPSLASGNNLIYHNNFIGNTVQAQDDTTLPDMNMWSDVYPTGGNYWGEYTGADANSDGIIDAPRTIPGAAGAMDSYPFLRQDGWALPYTTFRNVAWDEENGRFWICGDYNGNSQSTFYFLPRTSPTTMVPIMAPPVTFTALASDHLGNVLIAGMSKSDGLEYVYYFVPSANNGYSVYESGTGSMYGWNITSITYNSNDMRFYMVGNMKNQDRGVAFFTDTVPLDSSPSYCYIDNSPLMNSPGIGGLKSIEWNPDRNYALAVGDGVYRLGQWDGLPGNKLSWSTVAAPSAGTSYNDISWDLVGGIEAGIVGEGGLAGKYWRYYHTNPSLLDGYTSELTGTRYTTCAMKPPSSPKWLIIPSSSEIPRINLEEKDEGGTILFESDLPNLFTVSVWKQSDVTRPDLLEMQVDAGGTYTFFVEANYTVGGVDMWWDIDFTISAWYDNGAVGTLSNPGDPAWMNNNYRTRQFNITYSAATAIPTLTYPAMVPGIEEFDLHSYWTDPMLYGADGTVRRIYINVTFGPQTRAADGGGFANPNGGAWNKNSALNDPGSWDLQVHMYNVFNEAIFNTSYYEFGIKEYGAVSSVGSPTGSAPPGTIDHPLGPDCTVYFSANTPHFLTLSIPDLHMNGDALDPRLIPATNVKLQNTHSLAMATNSDMHLATPIPGSGVPLYIWGQAGTPLPAPVHGTESAGPLYSDYSAAAIPELFEVTEISWWINVPVSVAQGTYRSTITITISD